MAHLRSQIFAAVRVKLATIPEFSGAGKVARGRTDRIPVELLPALTLTWADRPEPASVRPSATAAGGDGYDRNLPLSIIVHLRDDDPEEEFDRIAVPVEAAMADLIEMPGLAVECLLQSSQFFVGRDTGISLLAGSIVYQVAYKTVAANPEISAL
ncbi:hypothetical protein P6U16_08395 [Rhizobium sp. 32-5/1]|uniref:hypothetical protein n=1 Tax=Rhizobium sp. 32-5/1 TaxID=3019602 RepID=UPI00240D6491|nr:hypothetical protein [Rhizobium sp. 32-5/1]WEZ84579.1 hypothetical protein P6U16_08395 [Rhizobium sp. 32-5/1]